ncbi:TlpA disulfide reductase family protein [Loktanella sp. Alg231-35]|uniref:TlpA disulfide reductase family protein n=1 Tax=Loktanella sp. Alg231-35 TaxID=1922220 RepID=UPI000D5570A2|nr:TlpA disulfide reductase family protein [Loktanella sp. Alg231-35]
MTLPELHVSQWFNTDKNITLASLLGKVIVVEAFQMLCPGCVLHGIPLAQKVAAAFPKEKVAVLGLHTVFEHHDAMTPVSLKAFLHEYRITFPVGVDAPGEGPMPKTMQAFQMRGTPSMLIFDKSGSLRAHHFGDVSELLLGAEIATLLGQERETSLTASDVSIQPGCGEDGCTI